MSNQNWGTELGLNKDQLEELLNWSKLSCNIRVKGWAQRDVLGEGAEVLYRHEPDAPVSEGKDVVVAVQSKRGFKFRVWTAGSWQRAEVINGWV